MTPEQIEKEREAFEEWCAECRWEDKLEFMYQAGDYSFYDLFGWAQDVALNAWLNRAGQAAADTARLDWLADRNNTIGNVQLPTQCVEQNLHSMRAAIDCAMALDKEAT